MLARAEEIYTSMYTYSICACARWEESYMTEWLEYHLSIGFQHFYIYSNNDDYRDLAETILPYIRDGVVTYTHCPDVGAQYAMYHHYQKNHSNESEWCAFIDIDEFITLPGFYDNIAVFVNSFPNHNSIQLNWLFFGNNGYKTRPAGSVLRQYTRCGASLDKHTKHISHRDVISKHYMKIMHVWHDSEAQVCNVLGHEVNSAWWIWDQGRKEEYLTYLSEHEQQMQDRAYVSHYVFKSEADIARRVARSTQRDYSNMQWYQTYADAPERFAELLLDKDQADNFYLKNYWENHLNQQLLPVGFDTIGYLKLNQDVMGHERPEQHYLEMGKFEGRAYPSI
jgi:Glycosyl transferase family 2